LDKILENPENPIAYKGLSDQYLELGMPDKALEVLNQGLALFPDMVELHFNRGLALDRLNRPDRAKDEYLWVLERKQDHLGACHNLSQIYSNENQFEKTIELLNRGIDVGLRHPAVFVLLGRAYNAVGKCDMALTSFDHALEIQPNCPDINCYKAVIFLNKKSYEPALNTLEKEIEIGGNLAGAYSLLGQMSLVMKDLESATKFFQKVLAIKPDDPTAKKHLESISLTQKRPSTISRSYGVNKDAKYPGERVRRLDGEKSKKEED
jgi:tetratricopeptide (TPR) repeat protein